MKKDIYILGINESHGASASLIKNGEIVASASEERFTKVKNQTGYPEKSIKFCLNFAGIRGKDLSSVNFGYIHPLQLMTEKRNNLKGIYYYLAILSENIQNLFNLVPDIAITIFKIRSILYSNLFLKKSISEYTNEISTIFSISPNQVNHIDHQTSHAYAAFYANPNKTKKSIVITLDGSGDNLCSRIFTVIDEKWKLLSSTESTYSLGFLYLYTTMYLGMKPNEHEYKVMGLAPYAHVKDSLKVTERFRKIMHVDDLEIKSSIPHISMQEYIKKNLEGFRFDVIAGGIQLFTEEIVLKLVTNAIQKTGIKNIVLSGGVFMNVKANMLISQLPEVQSLFIMPSCTDESVAIGAAYYGYLKHIKNSAIRIQPKAISNLYLGPEYPNKEITVIIRKLKKEQPTWVIKKLLNPAKEIAKILSDGNILARFSGRMEFGARALGNRSILSRADNPDTIRIINEQIKGRDFWMPFAPVILKERMHNYIINPKNLESPFMMLAFQTTPLARKELKAAIHPYDYTTRPQIIDKKQNAEYYNILKEFEKITNIGGILNTSFNLHGYPIACTPTDAISIFKNSGLIYLALGNYIIKK